MILLTNKNLKKPNRNGDGKRNICPRMRVEKIFVYIRFIFQKNGWCKKENIMENMKYVKRQENGNILLSPGELSKKDAYAPNGIKITPVTLSRMGVTIRLFNDFLAGTKEPYEYEIEGNKYRAFKDSGNAYLEETRGNIVSIVGFSLGEIPNVLEELKEM